ncbi:MAG: hypothetical protein MI892_06055 [Desulfobacterales bacterium]|nr:hypothetical protein [Desulfobacterales bacterium]
MKQFKQGMYLWVALGIIFLNLGCKASAGPVSNISTLERKVDDLVMETLDASQYKMADIAPAAVVSQSLLDGRSYTGLDDLVVRRLSDRLALDRELVSLSRENWMELGLSHPLSLDGHSMDMAPLVENMVVFVVTVFPGQPSGRVHVRVQVKDATGIMIPGIDVRRTLSLIPGSPAADLYSQKVFPVPAPKGVRENPFRSLEQLGQAMVQDLVLAMNKGIMAVGHNIGETDIHVVLSSKNFKGPDARFNRALIRELHQSLASAKGMTMGISQTDFNALFNQNRFYHSRPGSFEQDYEPLRPGSVFLMVDGEKDPASGAVKVSLRAIWRVSPFKDINGQVITDNAAGTYVSGFTSRAWFNGAVPLVAARDFPEALAGPSELGDKGFD